MAQSSEPPDIVQVEEIFVTCEGGGGALGHPKVFLKLQDREVECPYCGKKFVLKAGITPPATY